MCSFGKAGDADVPLERAFFCGVDGDGGGGHGDGVGYGGCVGGCIGDGMMVLVYGGGGYGDHLRMVVF